MTTPEDVHREVGAYALGILDPRDTARFERHLMACRSCPRELAELSPVVALLSRVDPQQPAFATHPPHSAPSAPAARSAPTVSTAPPRRPGRDAGVPASAVRARRGRGWAGDSIRDFARRALTLAACLGLVVAGAVVAVSLRLTDKGLPGVPPAAAVAQRLHAADPDTGAEATVQMEAKLWGSQLTLEMTKVNGPVVCRLVAVSKTGRREVVMGWSVPPGGYGTSARPEPLVLYGGTDLRQSDLSRIEVRTTDGALLVSVPA